MPPKRTPKDAPIVIVGAGVFGLSTALELRKRGYLHITVLDRFLPPVPDGSSVDISRIIRVDYADPVYSQMAREAYAGWNAQYSDHYHESGFVMLADRKGNGWLDASREVAAKSGVELTNYADANDVLKDYPSAKADFEGLQACINRRGGWADAKGAIAQLAGECSQLGVHSASGQPVGFIQLTEEEAERLKDMPVMINFESGVFIFPPTKGKNPILKLARHGYGYATEVSVGDDGSQRVISTPKRDGSNAATGYLPDDADEGLREGVKQLLPEFASRPWVNRRLCWYSDTPEGDFIMDYHPSIEGVFFATGGAGHAFKFLPVLGKYISDCFEEKAPQELRHKWRLRASEGQDELKLGDGSRGGPPLRKLTPVEQSKL
ncbi:hypothetical protein K4K51_002564 [Colletotrichum sp. SAR 10_75]|nr:hypothetical protein K4K51_002564 [Colletotrichum sp. SAR 10_75]